MIRQLPRAQIWLEKLQLASKLLNLGASRKYISANRVVYTASVGYSNGPFL